MAHIAGFESAQLEAVCKVLGDTSRGLTGTEIEHMLREVGAEDPSPSLASGCGSTTPLPRHKTNIARGIM